MSLILNNGVILEIGEDEVIINVWRSANPGPFFRHDGHASLQTKGHYMSFRPQGKQENAEEASGILITSLRADLKEQGNQPPHLRYTLNKETLGIDIHPKKIVKKFEELLAFNGLELSSLQDKEYTQHTKWAHKGLVSINIEEPFYTETRSSIAFVLNLLRSGINETPPPFIM